LAKIVGGELAESLDVITKKLNDVYKKIQNIGNLKVFARAVLTLINLVSELSQDVDVAIELTKTNQL
jgi:hypothetical protein